MDRFNLLRNTQTLGPPIYVRTQVKHWVLQLSQSLDRYFKSFSTWLHLPEISDHAALLSTMYRQPSIDLHRGFTELGFKSHPIGASATQAPTAVLQLFGTNRPILPMKRGGSVNPSANAVVLAGSVISNYWYPVQGRYDHMCSCLRDIRNLPWSRRDSQLHINCLELKAVSLALQY